MHSVSVARKTVRVGVLEVDRAPVTNARYAAFVAFAGHRAPVYWPNGVCPESLQDHPVVGVDLFDAIAYALWAGGRLPTELEWALASGLEEQRAFVWGDTFDNSLCNTVRSGIKGTTPVGSYAPAPSGCVDLIGNVWEMTCSAYPGDDEAIIVKGGSWYDFPGHAKLDTQFSARVNKRGNTVGFRLVYGGPMRLPAFLTKELAAECIAYRQAALEAVEPDEDPSEFLEVVSQLREEAWAVLPGLDNESLDVDFQAVDEALDGLDATALEASDGPATERVAARGPDFAERVQHALTRRPLTLLVTACLFASVAVWWASGGTGAAHGRRAEATSRAPEPVRRYIAPVRVPDTVRGSRRLRPGRMGRGFAGALATLRNGTAPQREEAERFLINNPEGAKERVQRALQGDLPEAGRASLRYVLAALAEREPLPPPRPRVVTAPPREGLVVFFETIDADTADEIAKVRRTARAEGLPLTVVFTGDENGRGLAKTYRAILGGARLYVDRGKMLARLWGVSRLPSVAGVKTGRLAFLHVGFIRRRALAEKVAELIG